MSKNQGRQGQPAQQQQPESTAATADANVGANTVGSPPAPQPPSSPTSQPQPHPATQPQPDTLLLWLADYLIGEIEPVQVNMLLRKCAEDLGLDQARRIAKRFEKVRPKMSGIARIGMGQIEALHRSREATRRNEEARYQERMRQAANEQNNEQIADPVAV